MTPGPLQTVITPYSINRPWSTIESFAKGKANVHMTLTNLLPPNAETIWEISRNAGSLQDPPREDIQPSNKFMLFFRPRQGVPSLCYVRLTTGKQKMCVAHYVEFPSSKITIFMLISSSNCVAWSFTAAMKYFVTVAQAYTSFTVTRYCSRATAPQRKTKASSWRAHDLWVGG